ncbi:MAG: type-F conjugative transfer system mating-pair stabilization protein TraN [Porticoccus sp.]
MTGRVFTVIALMLIASTAIASQEQRYTDNVNWAKQSATVTQGQSGFTAFSVNEYCQDTACQQQLNNPEQTRYRNDATAMDSAKTAAIATDDNAQAVQNNFNAGRPTIDPNDPVYSQAVGYMKDAYTISHGLVSQYHDCEKGQTCEFSESIKHCTQPTNKPVSCTLTPYVKNVIDNSGQRTFSHIFWPNNPLPVPSDIKNITQIQIPDMSIGGPQATNNTAIISANGVDIYRFPYRLKNCTNFMCMNSFHLPKMTLPQPISPSQLIINVRLSTGNEPWWNLGPSNITLYWTKKSLDIGWKNSCGPLLPECNKTQEICEEGGGSRWLHGVYQYLPCWKKRQTYHCTYPDTCAALSTCVEQSRQCSKNTQGVCVQEQVTKKCTSQTCVDTNLICGEQSFCLDGDCYNPTREQNTDFDQAASSLAALADAAKGLGDPPLLFTGKAMTCSKKPVGLSDCCKDSGWGNDIGLAQCSDEEKALVEAKKNKLTISLGQYCAEKVLGVCIRKKKAYCTYDSKLARIVQEQGKPQLGMNFGSAKHPDCSAITPEQMQQMDFSHMDFSDFYNDLHNNMTLPDNNQIQQRIKDALGGKQ